MGEHIVGPDDITVGWDPAHPGTVEYARREWQRLRDEDHDTYAPDGTALDTFDPSLGRLFASPRYPSPEIVAGWPSRTNAIP